MGVQPTLQSTVSNDTLTVKMSRSMAMAALEFILDHDSEVEEDVSEAEDHVEVNSASDDSDYEPDQEITIPAPPTKTLMSKNEEIQWSSTPKCASGKTASRKHNKESASAH